jgi:hypothetical protein
MTKYYYRGIEMDIHEDSDEGKKAHSTPLNSYKLLNLAKSSNEITQDDHEHQHHTGGVDKIDGKEIHLVKTQSGKYLSHAYPYMMNDTKLEVAKTLIDYVPEFGGKELKNE